MAWYIKMLGLGTHGTPEQAESKTFAKKWNMFLDGHGLEADPALTRGAERLATCRAIFSRAYRR